MVAEGVKTSASVVALSNKMGVEMPICEQVFEASAGVFFFHIFMSGGRSARTFHGIALTPLFLLLAGVADFCFSRLEMSKERLALLVASSASLPPGPTTEVPPQGTVDDGCEAEF